MQLIPLGLQTKALTGYTHKVVITLADLKGGGANLTTTFVLYPGTAPPTIYQNATIQQATANLGPAAGGIVVKSAAVWATTLLAGPSLSSAQMDIGDQETVGRFVAKANTDLFTTTTGNSKNPVLGSGGFAYTPADIANPVQMQGKVTLIGCNLNALTAGQIEVYLDIVDLNELVMVQYPGSNPYIFA